MSWTLYRLLPTLADRFLTETPHPGAKHSGDSTQTSSECCKVAVVPSKLLLTIGVNNLTEFVCDIIVLFYEDRIYFILSGNESFSLFCLCSNSVRHPCWQRNLKRQVQLQKFKFCLQILEDFTPNSNLVKSGRHRVKNHRSSWALSGSRVTGCFMCKVCHVFCWILELYVKPSIVF